jgi:hypothetical protein
VGLSSAERCRVSISYKSRESTGSTDPAYYGAGNAITLTFFGSDDAVVVAVADSRVDLRAADVGAAEDDLGGMVDAEDGGWKREEREASWDGMSSL